MPTNTIQLRSGLAADLPVLAAGEPAWTKDTKTLFVGDGATNHAIGSGGGGAGASIQVQYPAASVLSGDRAVIIEGDVAVYADNTVQGHAGAVLGVTTGGVASGATATIQTYGPMTDSAWSWTPDLPIWLGTAGYLTQTVPSSGFLLRVGYAIDATTMMVTIGESII